MGMFDYIRCEVPLPDGWEPTELQTKDFRCEMSKHVISRDGRLMLDSWMPGENATKLIDGNFHGHVNFYGNEITGRVPDDRYPRGRPIYRWHEYNAKFTDGQLVEIVCVPDDAPSPTPRMKP